MKNIVYFATLSLILVYFAFVIGLISPARHVDPDFFQFLSNSQYYLQGELPPNIQSLPANPILLGLIYKMLGSTISEIEVALWINAVSIIGAIYFMYVLLKDKTNQIIASLITIFLITHPIIYYTATSNNSEALFALLLMYLFLLIKNKKYFLATALSAAGVVIRYESVFIFGSFWLANLFEKRDLKKSIKYILLFLIIAVPLLFTILTTNSGEIVKDSPFLVEVVQRMEDLPELRFFTHFFFSLAYFPGFLLAEQNFWYICVGILLWSISFIQISPKISKEKLGVAAFIFTLLYIAFHACFPAYLERYFVPIIFSFILVLGIFLKNLSRRQQQVGLIALIFIIINNIWVIFPSWKAAKFIGLSSDYYASRSIAQETHGKEYTILTPFPEILEYYYRQQPNIKTLSVVQIKELTSCSDLNCAVKKYSKENNPPIIMLYTSIYDWGMNGNYDISLKRWYENIGFYELGDFIFSEKSCLWYQRQWEGEYITLKVYMPCE